MKVQKGTKTLFTKPLLHVPLLSSPSFHVLKQIVSFLLLCIWKIMN